MQALESWNVIASTRLFKLRRYLQIRDHYADRQLHGFPQPSDRRLLSLQIALAWWVLGHIAKHSTMNDENA